MTKPYLAAIGTACMDEYYQADTFVEEGDKLLVRPMEAKAGGMIANAACVMAGYGDHTFLIDYMNDGANSAALKDGLAKEGLDVSHIVTDNRLPDAKCIIVLTPKERTIFVVNFDRPERDLPDEAKELVKNASCIYTSMMEMRRFRSWPSLVDELKENGAKLVFDVEGTTFEDASDPLFAKADLLFFNETAMDKYAQGRTWDEAASGLLAGGCLAVVVTLGADGCTLYTREETFHVDGLRVPVVDTTGAGDTFNSTFVHGLVSGWSMREAAVFANAAAARSTTVLGARGGVAPEETVREFIRRYGQQTAGTAEHAPLS